MADKVTESNELKFEFAFADGDTRIFRLKNPIGDTSSLWTKLSELNSFMIQKGLIVGDKASGTFTGIYKVTKVNKLVFDADLE